MQENIHYLVKVFNLLNIFDSLLMTLNKKNVINLRFYFKFITIILTDWFYKKVFIKFN
jgi:hypothetical protein